MKQFLTVKIALGDDDSSPLTDEQIFFIQGRSVEVVFDEIKDQMFRIPGDLLPYEVSAGEFVKST